MAQREPLEGAAREESLELASSLDRVEALMITGDYKTAIEQIEGIEDRGAGLDDPATILRFAETRARLHEFAEDDKSSVLSLKRAYLAADRAGEALGASLAR